jgi:hypothetical protein
VGFCHYRRCLNFGRRRHQHGFQSIDRSEFLRIRSDLFDPSLASVVDARNAVVGRAFLLDKGVFSHYAANHSASEYLDIFKLVALRRPEIARFMAAQFDRRMAYVTNLFVVCWRDFEELCELWFGVLEEFTHLVTWPRASDYQSRDVAFLSERIFDAWIRF